MKRSLLVLSAVFGSLLVGCSSSPKTVAIESPLEMRVPDWYDNAPAPTKDNIYATGSADSSNFEASRDYARLSAKRMLCNQLNGSVDSMTQQFQQEVGKRFIRNTTTNTKQVCTDTNITGFVQDKIQTLRIGEQWHSFVLLKYPLGKNNFLLEEQIGAKAERDAVVSARQGQIDLEREKQDRRKREDTQTRQRQEQIAPDVVKSEPKLVDPNQLPHETVSDPKIKAQAEEAIKRGDAVILTQTIR